MGELSLFTTLKNGLDKGLSSKDLQDSIKFDESLLKDSNDYCMQCGNCCNQYCVNMYESAGLVTCLLHDASPGKKVASYSEVYDSLDSKRFTQPKVCRTSGPHVVFLDIVKDTKGAKSDIFEECPGANKMYAEYMQFVNSELE